MSNEFFASFSGQYLPTLVMTSMSSPKRFVFLSFDLMITVRYWKRISKHFSEKGANLSSVAEINSPKTSMIPSLKIAGHSFSDLMKIKKTESRKF